MLPRGTPTPVVRGLFALAALTLPVQYAVKAREGEPYPALYQPSFGGVPQQGSQAFTTEPIVLVTYGDGSREEFTARRLLPDNPVLPTSTLTSALVRGAGAEAPETAAWLRRAILDAHPRGRDPQRADVQVVTRAYPLGGGTPRRLRARAVRTLDLRGGA